MSVEVLFFGAHPDDVEWGAGGIAILLQSRETRFAIVDLSDGEMGSRGTIAQRKEEAKRASDYVGAVARESLSMPDGELADSPATRKQIASVIRRFRPKLVFAPYWEDRHPDHAAAGAMVRNSALYCALSKTGDPNPPHKPAAFLYYLLHNFKRPSFVVDVSKVYERKLELLRLHASQFSRTAEQLGLVSLGMSDYLFGLESRDRFFGSLIGAHHGEAIVTDQPLRLSSVSDLLPFAD